MSKKQKYTGRTYEELLKVKIADMEGEEYEFFQKKQSIKKTGTFGLLFAGAIEGAARSIREKKEALLNLGTEHLERKEIEEMVDEVIKEKEEQIRDSVRKQLAESKEK